MVEHGTRRVPEAEPADDDGEVRTPGEPGQADVRQRHLGLDEEARHEEVVVDLDLVHLTAGGGLDAPTKADRADGRHLPVELFEPSPHALLGSCVGDLCHARSFDVTTLTLRGVRTTDPTGADYRPSPPSGAGRTGLGFSQS